MSSPVTVVFGLSGMGVAPAGIEKEATSHHRLLIDRTPFGQGEYGAEEFELALPNDDTHKHFGGGQTQVNSGPDPRQATPCNWFWAIRAMCLSHDPPMTSDVIIITVE